MTQQCIHICPLEAAAVEGVIVHHELMVSRTIVHRVIFEALQCLSKCTPWAKDYFGMLRRWSAFKMCKKPLVNRPSIKDLANLFLGSVPLNSVLSGVRVHMYLRFPPVWPIGGYYLLHRYDAHPEGRWKAHTVRCFPRKYRESNSIDMNCA